MKKKKYNERLVAGTKESYKEQRKDVDGRDEINQHNKSFSYAGGLAAMAVSASSSSRSRAGSEMFQCQCQCHHSQLYNMGTYIILSEYVWIWILYAFIWHEWYLLLCCFKAETMSIIQTHIRINISEVRSKSLTIDCILLVILVVSSRYIHISNKICTELSSLIIFVSQNRFFPLLEFLHAHKLAANKSLAAVPLTLSRYSVICCYFLH